MTTKRLGITLLLALSLWILSCAGPTRPPKKAPELKGPVYVQHGIASWYGGKFHGKRTASGEIYNMHDLTAAHKRLPLGTYAMVTNLQNQRSVLVKINDRGPFVKGRIVDLSYAAARVIDIVDEGTAEVKLVAFGLKEAPRWEAPVYAVQVGSFSHKENAERLLEQLQEIFEEAYMTVLETSDGNYYRVRVGRYDRREKAYRVAERLVSLGYSVLITSR
ncbi:MAG: septal ring lytic transglycosylase RlpA family protein [Proteobacteria bacterium]|nr:septal ring lytic transglycosylase RlpA family protein [Pseudomonadota bacterium]NIS71389.1 septal ring lytic transglycosylase RlpA family protein [Pseudomonadota bacterium]